MTKATRRSGVSLIVLALIGVLYFWVTDPRYGPSRATIVAVASADVTTGSTSNSTRSFQRAIQSPSTPSLAHSIT